MNETQIPSRFLLKNTGENTNEEELARQKVFLERARLHAGELERLLGRTPTFCVVNFGCQANAKDSEKLAGVLRSAGFTGTESEGADFVIYNTCTVRDNADNHFFGRLGRASHFKKENPSMKIAVCGCMMQEQGNVEKIRKSYPYVDLIFGTHNLFRFPEYLCDVYEKNTGAFDIRGQKIIDIWDKTDRIVEDLPAERKYSFKAGVNIMFGCDNFCTYCIVPYVRGRERSRNASEILREVEALAADGVCEVMLLGQNVDSYGLDLIKKEEPSMSFPELLEAVAHIPGIERVRFMTPHPKDMSDDLIEVIRRNPNIARHIHLPLQSGSDRILKKMNRHYTKDQYIALAEKIRERIPDAAITTDIIAGFPGEEMCDVEDTLDVIRRVGFDNAYTFIYSIRRGTPAAKMEQVPEEQVKEGFDKILSAVQESARNRASMLTGRTMRALVEEVNKQDPQYVSARLSNNIIVHIPGDESMIGKFYDVHLDTCKGFYFFGTVVR